MSEQTTPAEQAPVTPAAVSVATEKWNGLTDHFSEDLMKDFTRFFDKGQIASGRRISKALRAIAKSSKELVKEVAAQKKAVKAARAAAKTA